MPTTYTETPDNFNEIGTFVEKEINGIKKIFYLAQRVIFYDACSFQRHSHLPDKEIKVLMNYFFNIKYVKIKKKKSSPSF